MVLLVHVLGVKVLFVNTVPTWQNWRKLHVKLEFSIQNWEKIQAKLVICNVGKGQSIFLYGSLNLNNVLALMW